MTRFRGQTGNFRNPQIRQLDLLDQQRRGWELDKICNTHWVLSRELAGARPQRTPRVPHWITDHGGVH